MGDFETDFYNSNYNMDGDPLYDDYDIDTSQEKYYTMIVSLTPSNFLNSNQRDMRSTITNNNNILQENFSIMHDKYNNFDSLAIEVYYQKVFIGYIAKGKKKNEIDNFCFIDNKIKDDLTIEWNGNNFILKSNTLKQIAKGQSENIEDSLFYYWSMFLASVRSNFSKYLENEKENKNPTFKDIFGNLNKFSEISSIDMAIKSLRQKSDYSEIIGIIANLEKQNIIYVSTETLEKILNNNIEATITEIDENGNMTYSFKKELLTSFMVKLRIESENLETV